MPHSLTARQKQYLNFLREYIANNESSPSLNEVATHFQVKPPTAHKMLKTLQKKGYLYSCRSKWSGYYIRLVERAGSSEIVTEVPVLGKFNEYGEVIDFPKYSGHFASLLHGANPDKIFSLRSTAYMPVEAIGGGDLIIFDMEKKPKPDDICIGPIGTKFFLLQITGTTFDGDLESFEMEQEYPVPPGIIEDRGQKFHWYPLAYKYETYDYFIKVLNENYNYRALSPDDVLATALRLTRAMSF